jgi:hypothetical protein
MADYSELCTRFFKSPLYARLGRNSKHAVVRMLLKRIYVLWAESRG